MWKNIRGIFSREPEPLSEGWIESHCTSIPLATLQAKYSRHGNYLIFHTTDLDSAKVIIKNKQITGEDVVDSAHFHPNPFKTAKQASATGCLLGFIWLGQDRTVDLNTDPTTHKDRSPDLLVHVPNMADSTDIWESRIYPITSSDLLLIHVTDKRGDFMLNQPLSISVIRPHT